MLAFLANASLLGLLVLALYGHHQLVLALMLLPAALFVAAIYQRNQQ